MRIACSAIVLFDLCDRSLALSAMYTSEGVLPLRNYLWQPDLTWRIWSLFYVGDSALLVGCGFLAIAAAAVLLLVGYQTRWASLALWVGLISLHHRNILAINGGDHYLRMLVFWGVFLPWGARYSVDAFLAGADAQEYREPPVLPAALGYLVQIALVYWSNALYKSGPSWLGDGSATYRALQLSDVGNGVARELLGLGWLLSVVTPGVWCLELLAPFFLLAPWPLARLAAVIAVSGLHLGILLTMRVELFSVVSLAALSGLWPALLWGCSPWRQVDQGLSRLATSLGRRVAAGGGKSGPPPKLSRPEQGLVVSVLLFVLVQGAHDYLTRDAWKGTFVYGRVLGLYVKWAMFSPEPPADAWQSAPATTASGLSVDLLTGRPPSASKLETVLHYEGWGRWRSYRSSVRTGYGSNAQAHLDFLVARWDRQHPEDPVAEAVYLGYREDPVSGYRLPRSRVQTEAVYTPNRK